MTILNNFCCCISLRAACLLVAFSNLITSILGVIVSFIGMCVSSPTLSLYLDLTINGFFFIDFTIMLLFSSSLLHGVLKRKPAFIIIYILYYLLGLLMAIVGIFSMHMVATFFYGVPAFVGGMIVGVIVCGMAIYILLVLYSYYLVLQKEEQQNEQSMQLLPHVQYMQPAYSVQHTQPAQHVQYMQPEGHAQHNMK